MLPCRLIIVGYELMKENKCRYTRLKKHDDYSQCYELIRLKTKYSTIVVKFHLQKSCMHCRTNCTVANRKKNK